VYRLTLIMFAIALVGCSNDSQDRVPLDGTLEEIVEELPPELQSQLDSANAAYRDRDYETALVLFERVTDEAPGLAAGWYGIGMTHTAMGNHAAADSAMMQVHRLAPEVPLQHPSEAPANPHPY
jgi:hypothetical protein